MIPVNTPLLDGNEKKYLIECIETGWISSEGPFVSRLEEGMCKLTERKHGIAVCNGSLALDIAVKAIGIEPGDEVIMPSFTIISCAAAVVRAGGIPVFVDSDRETWNVSVDTIKEAISERTKAIMVVHIYGLPVDMNPILELAEHYRLKIIEDAAEVHGQTYFGRPCGSFGDISTFSFYPNKHVTTGEGGMILSDNEQIAEACRSLRNLCFQKRRFVHTELGWNARMSNLQAAVGVAQLERLPEFLLKKRDIGKKYRELLAGNPLYTLQPETMPFADNVNWVFGILLAPSYPHDAASIAARLLQRGIATRPFFYPMHLQPVFAKKCYPKFPCPNAEFLGEKGFYLPSGLGLTDAELQTSAEALLDVLKDRVRSR
jgi:perosamine synthetase